MARATHLSFRPPRQSISGDGHPPSGPHEGNFQGQNFEDRRNGEREKGRGACSNQSGRYEVEQREAFDDGWGEDESLEPSRTNVTLETPRKIITKNTSPYVGFDRSINPYRGCEHGCIYCFARPTHAYMGLSPGIDFERELYAKPSAPQLLEKELSNPNYRARTVAMGTNTDPYQPVERKFRIMRGVLSIFSKFNHPVTILTKSVLITRDLDILSPMAEKNLTRAMVSITTQDRALARSMEPRASSPPKRFEAIKKLVEAGVQTGIMTGPMIPGLNDDEMESIMEQAASLGATFCGEMNGGRDYDPQWSRGGEIKTPYALLINQRNRAARARLGFDSKRQPLDLSQFRIPSEISGQLALFD